MNIPTNPTGMMNVTPSAIHRTGELLPGHDTTKAKPRTSQAASNAHHMGFSDVMRVRMSAGRVARQVAVHGEVEEGDGAEAEQPCVEESVLDRYL